MRPRVNRQRPAALALLLTVALAGAAPPAPERPVDFVRDVQPIFRQACYSCHGPQKQKGGLRLDRKASALNSGAILPGKGADSPLVHRVGGDDPDAKMPPKGPGLTAKQVALLRAWVDQGAPEGNPKDMPPPRQFSDLDKWHIGKPDIVISMPKPYVLKAKGGDEYYDVDIDPGFTPRFLPWHLNWSLTRLIIHLWPLAVFVYFLDVASPELQKPEGLAAFQKAEIEKWWPIIKAAGIKGD